MTRPRAPSRDPGPRSTLLLPPPPPSCKIPRPPLTICANESQEIVHNGLMGRPSRPLAGRHQQRRHAATTAGRARAGRCRHQVRAGRRGVRATGERRYGNEEKPTHDLDGRARQAAGDHAIRRKTAAEIAKTLGTSRNAVIGRSRRLRGIVPQSDIDSWTRANARRSAEAHKRAEIRGELQSKVIAEMIKSLSSGVPKERAMEKAFKAGAYWWQIGEHFGMSQQTAYETVKRAKKKRARK